MKSYDVVCVGHLAKDRNVVGARSESAVGGAVHYGGAVLLALGLRVAVVTRLARPDFPLLDALRERGGEVFPVEAPQTSGIENVHPDPGSDQRICHPLGFAGPFRPSDLPRLAGRLYYLGPIMPGEMDVDFLRTVAARGPLALDLQGMLRRKVGDRLVIDGWPQAEDALPLVRFLKGDDREAAALTGTRDLDRAAGLLAAAGPAEVVLTHRDGVVVHAAGTVYRAPFRPASLAGRTGRGDSCFAAYLGRRLCGDRPGPAARFAAALTTLKLERPGPFQGSLAEVERRAQCL
ncbi:MAG: PfkB family carbohydrate kinase [Candidatus Bipolaricaulaceae bacterium]